MEPTDPYNGDPVLRECVERAIQPYLKWPTEQVDRLRNLLILHATTHPAISPLYDRIRKTAVVNESSTTEIPGQTPLPKGRAANDG